jgi:hypothetical protein
MGQSLAFVVAQPSVTSLQHPVWVHRRQTQSGPLQTLGALRHLLTPVEAYTIIQAV